MTTTSASWGRCKSPISHEPHQMPFWLGGLHGRRCIGLPTAEQMIDTGRTRPLCDCGGHSGWCYSYRVFSTDRPSPCCGRCPAWPPSVRHRARYARTPEVTP